VETEFKRLREILEKADHAGVQFATDALHELTTLQNNLEQNGEHQRLAALYRVSRALGSTLDLDDVLRESMDAVIKLTGAERGFLMLLKHGTEDLELRAGRNFKSENLDKDEMEFSRSVIKEVVRTDTGVLTTNAQTDKRFSARDSIMRYALRSILCQPLLVRGRSIGVIYVDNKIKVGIFSEADRDLLEAFAAQAAVAIDNALLFKQTDASLTQRVAELETLHAIDRELNARLDLDRVLSLTLDWAQQGSASDTAWVAMIKDGQPIMILSTDQDQSLPEALDTKVLGPALTERLPLNIQPPDSSDNFLVVPAHREGNPIALIAVLRKQGPFEQAAEAFLLRLAERAAVAIENTRLFQSAQQADDSKSQFITMVTHELKIPMTSIRGYADLIRQGMAGPVSEQQIQFLDTIHNNVNRMADLVSDLSDISRLDTGQIRVELQASSMIDSLQETIANLRPQFESKSQQVQVDLTSDMPKVMVDRTRLVQILTNLLGNANKYTPESGVITINANLHDGGLRVTIRDTGIGLSEVEQSQLFSQFFRSEQPEAREQVGWGLGLYVTQRLLELMGGAIGVESSLGEGSTFWFTLPIASENEK
jgi:signal transduction histidine kinase